MVRYIKSKVEEPITYKKEFTIVAGINGVGKSTMVGLLKSNPNSFGTIIDPDDYAKKYVPGLYEMCTNITNESYGGRI